jgi:gliding motility-associated protein GldC
MKQSEIKFNILLDANNVPEHIQWEASDKPNGELAETKSLSISLWDHVERNTLRIDLWTKEMPVDEMKRFYIDCLGGLAQSILTSTGDEYMAQETQHLVEKLVEHLKRENEGA